MRPLPVALTAIVGTTLVALAVFMVNPEYFAAQAPGGITGGSTNGTTGSPPLPPGMIGATTGGGMSSGPGGTSSTASLPPWPAFFGDMLIKSISVKQRTVGVNQGTTFTVTVRNNSSQMAGFPNMIVPYTTDNDFAILPDTSPECQVNGFPAGEYVLCNSLIVPGEEKKFTFTLIPSNMYCAKMPPRQYLAFQVAPTVALLRPNDVDSRPANNVALSRGMLFCGTSSSAPASSASMSSLPGGFGGTNGGNGGIGGTPPPGGIGAIGS